jgi:hypothetical protein
MPWSKVVRFTDPLQCEAALQSTLRAEIIPVVRGRFHIEATQIGMDKLRMQRFKVALPQKTTVETSPDRRSIGFLLEASSPNLQHCGMKVTPNDIVMYGDDVLHQRSEANFHYGTMSVPTQDFLSSLQPSWVKSSSKHRRPASFVPILHLCRAS